MVFPLELACLDSTAIAAGDSVIINCCCCCCSCSRSRSWCCCCCFIADTSNGVCGRCTATGTGLIGPVVCVVWCTPVVRRVVLQCKQVPPVVLPSVEVCKPTMESVSEAKRSLGEQALGDCLSGEMPMITSELQAQLVATEEVCALFVTDSVSFGKWQHTDLAR